MDSFIDIALDVNLWDESGNGEYLVTEGTGGI
jgi:hypothetical protein